MIVREASGKNPRKIEKIDKRNDDARGRGLNY
jgi:hypothetical protein